MKVELENKLFDKHPKILCKANLPFGFECDDGWYEIIEELCRRITECLELRPDTPQVEAIQVKQKFGGLRFYATGGNEITDHLIRDAETISYKTCEGCGTMQNVSKRIIKGHWIIQLCDNCNG